MTKWSNNKIVLEIEGDDEEHQADQEQCASNRKPYGHQPAMVETAHVIRDEAPPDGEDDECETKIIESHITMAEWDTGNAG